MSEAERDDKWARRRKEHLDEMHLQDAEQQHLEWIRQDANLLEELMRQFGFDPDEWEMTMPLSLFQELRRMCEKERETMEKRLRDTEHMDLGLALAETTSVQVVSDGIYTHDAMTLSFMNEEGEEKTVSLQSSFAAGNFN